MAIQTLHYKRSAEYRQRVLLETGQHVEEEATLQVDLAELDMPLRERFVRVLGSPLGYRNSETGYSPRIAHNAKLRYARGEDDWHNPERPKITADYHLIEFDRDLGIGDLQAYLDAAEAANAEIDALKPELEAAMALYEAARAREAAAVEERKRLQAEKEAREEAARQARETEKNAWIEERGSDYLRKAVAAGYDCQRKYVLERAAIEHPDAVVDWADHADWKSRSCPSEAALDLALKVGGNVVWLTAEPRQTKRTDDERDYYDPFEPCEAVALRGYLGKYDLVWTSF